MSVIDVPRFRADKLGRVKKARSIIMHRAEGELKAIDGKLFNLLLRLAANRKHHRGYRVYRVPLADVVAFLNGATPLAVIESLRRLGEVSIEIDYEDAAPRQMHFLSFDDTTSGTGMLKWAFDPGVVELVDRPGVYTRLDLMTIRKFDTLAAARLYEVMMLHIGRKYARTWRVQVPEFYRFCGQFNERARFTNFRSRVLEPAVSEVNEHAPFTVDVQYIRDNRRGRQVDWIEFTPVRKSAQDLTLLRKPGRVRRVPRDKRSIDLFDSRMVNNRGPNIVLSEAVYPAAQGMIEGTGLELAKIECDFKDYVGPRVIRDADQEFLNFVALLVEETKDTISPSFDDVLDEFIK
ncbi:replication initiation protein [Bradyrhizobium sp. USDA 329]|uniref:replication initiation protein n=1 Tax=unclassified Bradyrhizobium TaxID=2631580 RepID=UPI0035170BC2